MDDIKELLKSHKCVVIKFTATWCKPCKNSQPFIENNLKSLDENVKYLEFDIDETLELYGTLKSKRILNGIPSLVCYKNTNETIYPDFCISSSSENDINQFFNEVNKQ